MLSDSLSAIFEEVDSSSLSIVQIGAYKGKDHISELLSKYGKKNDWTCLFVEPIKRIFKNLVENYKDLALEQGYNWKNLLFENSAISNETGSANIYRILPCIKAAKADKRASLIKSQYLCRITHKETKAEPQFHAENVRCLTLKDLLSKHSFDKLDFIQIDCEGYDFEIIKQIDFSSRFRPLLICYEEWGGVKFKENDDMSGNIKLGPSEMSDCRQLLENNSYLLHEIESEDTTKNIIAVDTTRFNFKF